MSTVIYWVLLVALGVFFAGGTVSAARRFGDRGLLLGAGVALAIFEFLGYVDWKRDMEAPLTAYVLLGGVPTVVATAVLGLLRRRTHLNPTLQVVTVAAAWIIVAFATFLYWPHL